MNSIIEHAARIFFERYLDEQRTNPDAIPTFIFPGRRACLFFNRQIAREARERKVKPFFAPRTCTINDFILELCPLHATDRLLLLFELYKVYATRAEGDAEGFDRFIFWGEMILRDFDEMDKYLLDPAKVFANVRDLEELRGDARDYLTPDQQQAIISFWREFGNDSAESGEYDEQRRSIRFYQNLSLIYTDFVAALKAKGVGYDGLIYRHVAEQQHIELPENVQLVFVGLFSLSVAERCIMQQLSKIPRRTLFLWDYSGVPRYAPDVDPSEPALNPIYKVLERNREQLGGESFGFTPAEQTPPADIDVIAVNSTVAQSKLLPTILAPYLSSSADNDEAAVATAIVPADEDLLMPVLNSLCEGNDTSVPLNVTMTYPLIRTQVHTLLDRWLTLRQQAEKRGSKTTYYPVNDLSALFSLQILRSADSGIDQVSNAIRTQKSFFLRSQDIYAMAPESELLPLLLHNGNSPDGTPPEAIHLLQRLKDILRFLTSRYRPGEFSPDELPADEAPEIEPPIVIEYLETYSNLLKRLDDLFGDPSYNFRPVDTDSMIYLVQSLVRTAGIPFEGEPLQGLQVMGMLETRALSFRRVVILSASEGKLPRIGPKSTLIPYVIRYGYGLPVGDEQECITAYHFFRLVNNAEQMYLIYDTRNDGASGAMEESRYIKQLELLYHYNVRRHTAEINFGRVDRPIVVRKTPEITEKLNAYLHGGAKYLAPSHLNSYIACPLQFYFSVSEGLREPDEPTEILEAGDFGTLLHESLQAVCTDICGSRNGGAVDGNKLADYLADEESNHIREIVLQKYCKLYGCPDARPRGELSKLNVALISRYVRTVLRKDRELFTAGILKAYRGFEYPIKGSLTISGGRCIQLKGIIDRIDACCDEAGDYLRIVDYKTGSPDLKIKSPERAFRHNGAAEYKEMLQLFIYAEMISGTYEHQGLPRPRIQPIVYALKAMQQGGDNGGALSLKNQEGLYETITDYGSMTIYDAAHGKERVLREVFLDLLRPCLDGLFDTDRPFTQALPGSTACRYCHLCGICGR